MPRLCLVAFALFLIISNHSIGSSQLFDLNPMADSTLDLFDLDTVSDPTQELSPEDDSAKAQVEIPPELVASDCPSNIIGNPSKVRARGDSCPTPQESKHVPNPDEARDVTMRKLLSPLNLENGTEETTQTNFVLSYCPNHEFTARAIPVCSSGLGEDEYPNAFGGWTLRNCDLRELVGFIF
jgi:hypothetical protein